MPRCHHALLLLRHRANRSSAGTDTSWLCFLPARCVWQDQDCSACCWRTAVRRRGARAVAGHHAQLPAANPRRRSRSQPPNERRRLHVRVPRRRAVDGHRAPCRTDRAALTQDAEHRHLRRPRMPRPPPAAAAQPPQQLLHPLRNRGDSQPLHECRTPGPTGRIDDLVVTLR